METFHQIVLFIAVACLILLLTGTGVLLNQKHSAQLFPPAADPNQTGFPTYWTYDETSNTATNILGGKNTGNLKAASFAKASGSSNVRNHLLYGDAITLTTTAATAASSIITLNIGRLAQIGEGPTNGKSPICNLKMVANNLELVWDNVSTYNGC